jgi:hypothetical protein
MGESCVLAYAFPAADKQRPVAHSVLTRVHGYGLEWDYLCKSRSHRVQEAEPVSRQIVLRLGLGTPVQK